MGDIVSIVGPTGCGKTTLINDIELFANRNTPSQRKFNKRGTHSGRFSHLTLPNILLLRFLSILIFYLICLSANSLKIHSKIRGAENINEMIEETLNFANQLTGEAIIKKTAMTELSGGQTRSLLIADAVIIGNSPIILLDEIGNAGIHRTKRLNF